MPAPKASEMITESIRVQAKAFFLADESNPEENRFVFGYRISITNQGERAIRLRKRYWKIIDGNGKLREVDGNGVVGKNPLIEPGANFKYTSFTMLETDWGTMEGAFGMQHEDGTEIEVQIGRFWLIMARAPSSVAS